MPSAAGQFRDQVVRRNWSPFNQAVAPPAALALSISRRFKSPQQSNAGITRRPTRLLYMRVVGSAVGCMPLLDFATDFKSIYAFSTVGQFTTPTA